MKRLLVLALAGIGTACVSVLPEPETPDALYRIGPLAETYEFSGTLIVNEPESQRLIGGRAIASEAGDGSIRYVPGVEWTDSMTQLMQTAMLDAFRGTQDGFVVDAATGTDGDYELLWRISDFTLSETTANCRIEATLLSADRSPIAQSTFTATAEAIVNKNPDRARALADAGRACVAQVAEFVVSAATPSS